MRSVVAIMTTISRSSKHKTRSLVCHTKQSRSLTGRGENVHEERPDDTVNGNKVEWTLSIVLSRPRSLSQRQNVSGLSGGKRKGHVDESEHARFKQRSTDSHTLWSIRPWLKMINSPHACYFIFQTIYHGLWEFNSR